MSSKLSSESRHAALVRAVETKMIKTRIVPSFQRTSSVISLLKANKKLEMLQRRRKIYQKMAQDLRSPPSGGVTITPIQISAPIGYNMGGFGRVVEVNGGHVHGE